MGGSHGTPRSAETNLQDIDTPLLAKADGPAQLDIHALQRLQGELEGELFLFGKPGYEEARLGKVWDASKCKPNPAPKVFTPASYPTETFNLATAGLPSAIAVVAITADVQACVKFCAQTGAELGIAGGRHSHLCMKDQSFVIDLQRMRECTLMAGEEPILRCEGGALNGDVHAALDGTGLMFTLGHHPGTGIGGLVQQGGHGPLEKVFGLAIDALLGAEVVTADGEVRRCSRSENADLFWCVRGGCGNFGVVTIFEFRPSRYKQAMPARTRVHLPLGACFVPSRKEIVRNYRDTCEVLPNTTSPLLIATPFPIIEVYYEIGGGDDSSLSSLTSFGKPVSDELRTRDYVHEICWDYFGPSGKDNLAGSYYPTSALLAELPDAACDTIAEYASKTPSSGSSIVITQLGGAAALVPKDATSVYHRDAKYWVIIIGAWQPSMFRSLAAEKEKAISWAKGLRSALMPYSIGRYGALSAEVSSEWDDTVGDDPLAFASWGANCTRLREIKGKFDPTNLFHLNHNIKP